MSGTIIESPTGQVMIDPVALLGSTRYNGGWIKCITGLDKRVTTGYSLLGDFMARGRQYYRVGGLYLDCDIQGSRKNQVAIYKLFRVVGPDEVQVLGTVDGGRVRQWAVALWPQIEAALEASEPEPEPEPAHSGRLADYSTQDLLQELRNRLAAGEPGMTFDDLVSILEQALVEARALSGSRDDA